MALITKYLIETNRLLIRPLDLQDAGFIHELLNSEGWLKYIGNRNINNLDDARRYIDKVLDNSILMYHVVELKSNRTKAGVVTFIKRKYLPHNDIGFAFLPEFWNQGYAFESTKAVLNKLLNDEHLNHIYATTVPINTPCVHLLKRLGMEFEKEIEIEKEKLHLYGASAARLKSMAFFT